MTSDRTWAVAFAKISRSSALQRKKDWWTSWCVRNRLVHKLRYGNGCGQVAFLHGRLLRVRYAAVC